MAETNVQRSTMPTPKTDSGFASRSSSYGHTVPRPSYGAGLHPAHSSSGMSALTNAFNGLGMQDASYSTTCRHSTMSGLGGHYAGIPPNNIIPPPFWTNNPQMMYAGTHPFAGPAQSHAAHMYTPSAAHYVGQGYVSAHDNSPTSQDWTPSQTTGDVPTLITPRRDSLSSAEHEDPGTPSYANYPGYPHAGVSIINRSPSGTFTTSTPSPLQVMASYGMPMQKVPDRETISPRLQMIVRKEPSIPPAVPAPSSPLKPLDRALENVRGETNVYIRGLLPETSDEMLENWGRRFGDIKSSKSIIDHTTGLCKGFGFVRYHNYSDAEDCIRGFHFLGYEVSFARESFYSKLKAIADDGNTNLYVSNLPKSMNEHELGVMFEPHEVLSARILRDKDGVGRGVGFARFESRQACEDVIKAFNNRPIQLDGEEYTVQIRYADTQEQKHLKQTTAAARQFRSAEYEYATQAHKNGWLGGDGPNYAPGDQENMAAQNDFEHYLGTKPGVPIQHQRWAQPAWRQGAGRSPLSAISSNHGNIPRRSFHNAQSGALGKSVHAARNVVAVGRHSEDQPKVASPTKDVAVVADGID